MGEAAAPHRTGRAPAMFSALLPAPAGATGFSCCCLLGLGDGQSPADGL